MYYSITVKLPKSKIQQYDILAPISVNDLSAEEFINTISQYNHIQLLKKINNLTNGVTQIKWETLSPEKSNLLTQFYSANPIYFADINTNPGDNGTLSQKDGIYRVKDIPNINKSNQAYLELGVNPIPFFRKNNQNYFIPNYEINPLYKIKTVMPDAQTFQTILKQLIEKNVLSYPLAQKKYNYTKPDFYQLDDVYYFLPHYNTLITPQFAPLLEVFNKFKEIETVYEFKDNLDAWTEFLNSLPSYVLSEKTYDKYIMLMNKMHSPFTGSQGTEIPVYHYKDAPYYVPTYETLRKKYSQLFPMWKKIIIDKKPVINSQANEVFRQIKNEGVVSEIINDGLIFDTEFNCKEDPRWDEFIRRQILKISDNVPYEEAINEARTKSPKLYLFSSIKSIKKEIFDNGKKKHCFNLSNNHFEKIPDGPWKSKIAYGEIFEFTIYCDQIQLDENNQKICTKWICESRTPTAKGEIKLNVFEFLQNINFNEYRYAIDAVLVDGENKIQYILEFDGTDHYFSKRKDGNPSAKIVSDQVKNNFARFYNIPCIRIPGFKNDRELNFKNNFKTYIINLIRERYNLPPINQELEAVNPAIKEFNLSRK
jgi:hypothetical protein